MIVEHINRLRDFRNHLAELDDPDATAKIKPHDGEICTIQMAIDYVLVSNITPSNLNRISNDLNFL